MPSALPTPSTKTAPAEVQLVEGQNQNIHEEDRSVKNATPTLTRPTDIGPTLAAEHGTDTVVIRHWSTRRSTRDQSSGLYHLIWCEEPLNDMHPDAYDAMPLGTWGHLSPEARAEMTVPGYQWGDDPTAPEWDGQHIITYIGLYRLVASGTDVDGAQVGVFERTEA